MVRQIWGKSDTILLIFAGASSEFALNQAVDWLYFTGKLPADPLGRLFSTVSYARAIVFAERETAWRAIDKIVSIHVGVEARRGHRIPQWAYRDVLFMLVDYSIRAFEILERKLNTHEKEEVLDVFNRVGGRMGIKSLPDNFREWEKMRLDHLKQDLKFSYYTEDLYRQYRKHLGEMRYTLLLESQKLVLPDPVIHQMKFRRKSRLRPFIIPYKLIRWLSLDGILKALLLPSNYKKDIRALDLP